MRPDELTELLRVRPFIPFRIHMTDGQTFDIRHPEIVLVLRQRVDIGVKPDPQTGVLERVEHCSLLHIVRVEQLAATAAGTGEPPNGQAG
jgi:hypothetical protein